MNTQSPAATPPIPTLSDQELVQLYLATRSANCPRCDYELRGSRIDQCPECGELLRLELPRPVPRRMIVLVRWAFVVLAITSIGSMLSVLSSFSLGISVLPWSSNAQLAVFTSRSLLLLAIAVLGFRSTLSARPYSPVDRLQRIALWLAMSIIVVLPLALLTWAIRLLI